MQPIVPRCTPVIAARFAFATLLAGSAPLLLAPGAHAQAAQKPASPILLHVDFTDAPRHLLHVREIIPVVPGPLTLEYPEWIPGDHRPTGPIDNVAGLFIRADGKDLPWRRDEVDMYGVHVEVPRSVHSLEVAFDFLAAPGGTGSDEDRATSNNLTVLEWSAAVLYPAEIPVHLIPVTPSITVPSGWNFGTALTQTSRTGNDASFQTTNVGQLVDSPLITGLYFREIPLAPEVTPKHYLDVAADDPEELNLPPATLDAVNKLVRETGAVYRSRHYDTYHFILSLSDKIRGEGLEHHQSSDNGIEGHGFSDPKLAILNADLLCHEFTHSWNGKYRRPIGLATPDYKTPQRGDLLWVYEGMTQYWGGVLAARSGFWTPEQYRDALAVTAANMNNRPGRTWRNVQDTAIAASILRGGSPWWSTWRLGQDYYPEGDLIWLDADATIRDLTHDQKSLNDFAGQFLSVGGNTGPIVLPYNFDDIVKGLNAVAPYNWRDFLSERLNTHSPRAPINGIEHSGWRLVYKDKPNSFEEAALGRRGFVDAAFSVGVRIGKDGSIADVLMDSLAYKAGLGPGEKVIAVNGFAYSPERFRHALAAAKGTTAPIELIVSNDDEFHVVRLDYHDGEKYPWLERIPDTPDRLSEIIRPLTGTTSPAGNR
jgi:predicted metalloprotease with PDZ domain